VANDPWTIQPCDVRLPYFLEGISMKRLALAFVLLAGPAWAQPQQQPPEVINVDNAIEVAVGEAKVLRFGQAFASPVMTTKDIADIIPQTDRMLTITGLSPGATAFFLKDDKDRVIYTGSIVVTPSSGSLVKIYGNVPGPRAKDYVSYYCNQTGCSRANPEKRTAGGRDPDEPVAHSTTVWRPTGDGGSVSTTRQYRD
jgi:hypothetical protein